MAYLVRQALLAALSLAPIAAALPWSSADQSVGNAAVDSSRARKLHGRFLHITDIHPDPFYKVYSSTEQADDCHHGVGPAGIYGAETTDCDSPYTLVNETFRWIDKHLKGKVDFVIWTGDSARHDEDETLPRAPSQVISQNEYIVSKFFEVFGKDDDDDDPTNDFSIPIVPTFGNNDIMPHNIFTQGPNYWTKKYLDVWRNFIPEEQRHSFAQGGWFYVEVIPGKLAVFSLNTMYFFAKNAATDGCADKGQPGYEHFEWLRIQLQFMRDRGMKAILEGHVPPARTENNVMWDETCWQKYTLWMQQYRDVIIGSMYGHMNIDHFMVQNFNDVDLDLVHGKIATNKGKDEVHADVKAESYLKDLRDAWANLPKLAWDASIMTPNVFQQTLCWLRMPGCNTIKDSLDAAFRPHLGEDFSISLVHSSIVPNYFPTLRVIEYNISGLEHATMGRGSAPPPRVEAIDASRKKHKKTKFTMPEGPSKSSPPGPAYSMQPLSWLSLRHYFANITYINNDTLIEDSDDFENEKWKKGKHHGKKPKQSKPHPKKFEFEVEYDTKTDKKYKMKDLTVRSWLGLARRIGSFSHADLRTELEAESTNDEFENDELIVDEHEGEAEDGWVFVEVEEDADNFKVEKKKHKKKKHHKHKHHKKGNKDHVWFEFVKRAFVGTMDPEDIQEQYGDSILTSEEKVEL